MGQTAVKVSRGRVMESLAKKVRRLTRMRAIQAKKARATQAKKARVMATKKVKAMMARRVKD